jgi:Ca2+-transporting ATPase
MPGVSMERKEWYRLSREEVLRALESGPQGLDQIEAKRRLEEHGPNVLREEIKTAPLKILLDQFKNFLVLILIGAVVVSAAIGEVFDAGVIFVLVMACAALGFVQEHRSQKAIEALKRMAAPRAKVIRDGKEEDVPAREIVPGDIILLATGDQVPADARILEAANLTADESSLTGESIPVEKTTEPIDQRELALGDRVNMVYSATVVTYGRGKGIVTATGMGTEFGKIAGMIQEVEEKKTPLEERLDHIGKWLGILCLAVVAIVFLLEVFLREADFLEIFVWSVSLAVAAVPEALPAVVTGSLAIGVQRMARNNAIVRRLPAVETLGCTTVICSDKTGTLTKNEMTVRKIYAHGSVIEVTGAGFEPLGEFLRDGNPIDPKGKRELELLLKAMILCNDAKMVRENDGWSIQGDPTEGALLVAARKGGMDVEQVRADCSRIDEVPFESERKRMTVICSDEGEDLIAWVKGAPEEILSVSTHIVRDGRVEVLSEEEKREILGVNEAFAFEALRVLGGACRILKEPMERHTAESVETGLVFLGLMGMIDPPREEVRDAIVSCVSAGIRPIMITGDNKTTAIAVVRELGQFDSKSLQGGQMVVLSGVELDRLDDEEFEGRVEEIGVYARVSPEHKLRIVRAWQNKGQVVAMTGDGVNDAPALKQADIGVAMGITGTDVTKEAADMTLADDNFATIVRAIEEGRGIYNNIKKYLVFLLSCNVGEILILGLAGLLGLPVPLIALQILWVNLITDGLPALALGVDPPEPDLMELPPRDPKESIFTEKVKLYIGGLAVNIFLGLFPLFYWYWKAEGLAKAQTMVLVTIILFEMFIAFNCRSTRYSIFKLGWFSNKWLVLAVLSSVFLMALVLYVPSLAFLFHTVPLGLSDWIVALLISSSALVFVELYKLMWERRHAEAKSQRHD